MSGNGAGRARATCLLALCTAALLGADPAAAANTTLPAQVQPGQLVIAQTRPGNTVRVDGRETRVDAQGRYVFGVGRDAGADLQVEIHNERGSVERHAIAIRTREYKIERVDGLPQHTVTPDPELAKRIAEEQARVARARERDDARSDYLAGFQRPVQGRISGVYGSQRIDNGVAKAPHYGLDIAVPTGTPVHAPAAGIVSFAATDLVLTGGTVLIDHGHGLTSSFLHLSRIDVKAGDRVERGEVFAAAGATGRASGPHVHWGFNWFDVRLDPALLPVP